MRLPDGGDGAVYDNTRSDRVKLVRSLSGRSARERSGAFRVEGPLAVREALSASARGLARLSDVFLTAQCDEKHPDLAGLCARSGLRWRLVSDAVIGAMADGDPSTSTSSQGVIAVCRILDVPLDDVLASGPRLVAVLDRVADPGNAGTVIRAADAAGADAVVMTRGSVDPYNPKVVRSTVGSLFHVPLVIGIGADEVALRLAGAGVQTLATDVGGDHDLEGLRRSGSSTRDEDPDLARPTAWLFGNEAHGLDPEVRARSFATVRIPLRGRAESLNLAMAATLCLFESARALASAEREAAS